MKLYEIFLLGVALSMDAFAVSICKGVKMRKFNVKQACIIALFFGGFQALMPLIGWMLGKQFEEYLSAYDHWIAFGLLLILGAKTIIESFKSEEEKKQKDDFAIFELFVMAIATSIDALTVGITFGISNVDIWSAIAIIGITTALICFAGTAVGHKFGTKFKRGAEIAGGAVLILIGLKILLEHLGFIAF